MCLYIHRWPRSESGSLVNDWFMGPPEWCGVLCLNLGWFLWQSSVSPQVCQCVIPHVFVPSYILKQKAGGSRHVSGDPLPSGIRDSIVCFLPRCFFRSDASYTSRCAPNPHCGWAECEKGGKDEESINSCLLLAFITSACLSSIGDHGSSREQ